MEPSSSHMFGLHIFRHSAVIRLPSHESYSTLADLVNQNISFTHIFLNRELAYFQQHPSDPRLRLLFEAKKLHFAFYRDFTSLRSSMSTTASLTGQIGSFGRSISRFFPWYRGFFLTILHKFVELKENLSLLFRLRSQLSLPKYISRLEIVTVLLGKFGQLFELAVRLELMKREEIEDALPITTTTTSTSTIPLLSRVDSLSELYHLGHIFPFNAKFPLSEVEFDNSIFYERIGRQYVANARLFFELYVGVLAGLWDTVRHVPENSPELIRLVGANALGMVYQLWPKRKARKNLEFAEAKDLFEAHGYGLWNVPGSVWVKPLFEIALPPIAVSKVFEVPIPDDLIRGLSEELADSSLLPFEQREEEEIEEEGEMSNSSITSSLPSPLPNLKRNPITGIISMNAFRWYLKSITSIGINASDVPVRIVSPFALPSLEQHFTLRNEFETMKSVKGAVAKGVEAIGNLYFAVCGAPVRSEPIFLGDVIMHFHGGGFIAMSSHSHEMYVRRWAKTLNMPVVSVDYTNAPKERYPTQVLQCYAAYRHFVENSAEFLGRPLRRLILAGDSAGGNLVVCVAMLAIAQGIRKPDALIASYPTLLTSYEACPSRVMAFVDPLVSKPFLELCLKFYPDPDYEHLDSDPFISPITCPDEILSQFPPTYLTACSLDPLYDDGVALAKRLERVIPGRVRLSIFDGLPHGYLNFCDILKESREEVRRIADWVRAIIHEYYHEPTQHQLEMERRLRVERQRQGIL